MKIVLAIGLTLVVLGVGVVAVGWMLPVEHRSVVTRTIPAPADEVWARIASVEDWATWRTDVRRVEMEAGDRAVVTDSNGRVRYRIERTADRTLVTTIDQEGLPYGGRWIWSVEPAEDGISASVTVEEEGEVYNPVFRFVSRFILGHDATIRSVLDELESSVRSQRPRFRPN